MLRNTQSGEPVLFDWRSFSFDCPTADSIHEVTDLRRYSDLHPEIHGMRYSIPGANHQIVLLEPAATDDRIFFPFNQRYWVSEELAADIESFEQAPLISDPVPLGNNSLKYLGRFPNTVVTPVNENNM